MLLPAQAELVRIYIGESYKFKGRPLYEVIVEKARADGLAGATVLRGLSGFGAKSLIHSAKILRLSEDLPLVVDIVDVPEKLDRFLDDLDGMLEEGLVIRQPVHVHFYHKKNSGE